MRGHQELIAMRLKGKAPSAAVLHVVAGDWPMSDEPSYVQADEAEALDRADLRCFTGLRVIVYGANKAPVMRACQAVAAKAGAVLGYVSGLPTLAPESMVYASGEFFPCK
jgi:hypothetical protein